MKYKASFPRDPIRSNEQGFTLSELIIVIVLTTLFSILLLNFTFDLWHTGYLQQADLDTLTTRLNAGDILREQIGSSSGLIIQNSLADTHTLVPDPAIASGNYWLPIHAIPGNKPIGGPGTYTPLIYYSRFSQNSSGSFIMNGAQPYQDEYVLYFNGTNKSLMLRSIANTSAPGNRLQTSCPPTQATSSCPADKIVASDLASIDLRYFSRTGNVIDYTSIIDPLTGNYAGPDFPVVEVAEFTFHITKRPVLQSTNVTQNTTIIRIALRNT